MLRVLILTLAGSVTFLAYLAIASLLFGFDVGLPLGAGCALAGGALGAFAGFLTGRR
jgi:hypothetical protein